MALQKKGKKVSCPVLQCVLIRYDARSYRMLPDRLAVSLATIDGRQVVEFDLYFCAEKRLDRGLASIEPMCLNAMMYFGSMSP